MEGTANALDGLDLRDDILIVGRGFLGFLDFLPNGSPNSPNSSSSSAPKDTAVPTEDESSPFPFLEGGLKFSINCIIPFLYLIDSFI